MLTGAQVLNYLDCYIFRYADLKGIKNIDNIVTKKPIIILYPTNIKENVGHFCLVFYNRKTKRINFFDPYGGVIDQDQLNYSKNYHDYYLSDLISESKVGGNKAEYSEFRLQGPTSTLCGNWCIVRAKFPDLTDEEFFELFKDGKTFTSDDLLREYFKTIKPEYVEGGSIRNKDEIYALISQESYVSKDKRKHNIEGYTYYKDASTERTAIYVNNTNNTIIIGHRGTVPTNKSDLEADVYIATGTFGRSNRLKRSKEVVDKAIQKYPNYKIENTGHSLGGRVALEIARKLPVEDSKAVVFNPGFSPLDIGKTISDNLKAKNENSNLAKKIKNQTIYSTGLDPVSISGLLSSGVKVIKPTSINIHSLSNF